MRSSLTLPKESESRRFHFDVLNEIRDFLKDRINVENWENHGLPYCWIEVSGSDKRAIIAHKGFVISIDCIVGFIVLGAEYGHARLYEDDNYFKFFQSLWNYGVRKTAFYGLKQLFIINEFKHKLFHKDSLIEKYEGQYLKDTVNMLSDVLSEGINLNIPDGLSLRNLHDFLARGTKLKQYEKYRGQYARINEEFCKLSGTYKIHGDDYDVRIPASIDDHFTWGTRFNNCINSYMDRVGTHEKILFVFTPDDKPLFCVHANFSKNRINIDQATLVNNKSLDEGQQKILRDILNRLNEDFKW